MINNSLIESIFLRYKAKLTFTKLWRIGDEAIKNSISRYISLEKNELPIIYYFRDDSSSWWVLSNNAIYIKSEIVRQFNFNQITGADIDSLLNGAVNKMEVNSLRLNTSEGVFELPVEQFSWPTIYEMINFVAGK